VLAVVSDEKQSAIAAEVLSVSDYYPFGMEMPGRKFEKYASEEYRFGFNTQEKTLEVNPSHSTAFYWEYDGRLGRRWNVDPKPDF